MEKTTLFNAIIRQAIEDLYDKDNDVKNDALDWFYDPETVGDDRTKVTFHECCDFTGRTPYPMRKLIPFVIAGKLNKAKVLEYFNGECPDF